MANAKDITTAAGNVLIIGPGGSNKTGFLGELPGVYIYDFDAGIARLKGKDVNYDTFKDAARIVKTRDNSGKASAFEYMEVGPVMQKQGIYKFGTAWDAFYKKLLEQAAMIEKADPKAPKVVATDSLSFMSMMAVNKILKDTGHEMPHQGTWGAHHEYFKTIFSMVTAWPIRLVATAHVERAENDLTGTVEKLPMIVGKMAALIPTFFDEVWYVEKDGDKWIIRTEQTSQLAQAKSRLWNIPDKTPFFTKTGIDPELKKLILAPK